MEHGSDAKRRKLSKEEFIQYNNSLILESAGFKQFMTDMNTDRNERLRGMSWFEMVFSNMTSEHLYLMSSDSDNIRSYKQYVLANDHYDNLIKKSEGFKLFMEEIVKEIEQYKGRDILILGDPKLDYLPASDERSPIYQYKKYLLEN